MLFVRSLSVIFFLVSFASAFFRSPLLVNSPGFGTSCRWIGDGIDEMLAETYGDWEYSHYHGSLEYSYRSLDSLYRQSQFEWETQFLWKYLGVGGTYGLSMEWIPEQGMWTRHLYRGGLVGLLPEENFQLGVWLGGYGGEEVSWMGALLWEPSPGLNLFGDFSPDYAWIGYALCFTYLCLESGFRAPGFAVELAVSVNGSGWKIGGGHGFGGKDLDWNGLFLQKSIKK